MNSHINSFDNYLNELYRKWIGLILIMGIVLVPLFGLLDLVMMPSDKLYLFWILRGIVTIVCISQYFLLKKYTPDKFVISHAYVFTFVVGGMISYMTTHLGGFDSSYYAGLNLVFIAVNLFLPWNALLGAINGIMILLQYILLNLVIDHEWMMISFVNNLYFIVSTIIIAVTIGHYKHILTKAEFNARTSLWGEMEIAKKIQTALLPKIRTLPGYEIACDMQPADEVGGDYYDFIEPENSDVNWICIGDVSGHGVTAGLVMMMAQTSLSTLVNKDPDISPSDLLSQSNEVLKDNISRLGESKYLTITALKLKESQVTFSGLHQDILVFRKQSNLVEAIETRGFWLGIKSKIGKALYDDQTTMQTDDIMLLYTDGVIELADKDDLMYGIERLSSKFEEFARKQDSIDNCLKKLREDISNFSSTPDDDISLVIIKKT